MLYFFFFLNLPAATETYTLSLHDALPILPAKRVGGRAVIIAPMSSRDGTSRLPTVLTEQGKVWHLRPHEVTEPVASQGRVRVPKKFNHRQAGDRRQLLSILEQAIDDGRVDAGVHWESSRRRKGTSTTVAELQQQLRDHPCHDCPDREMHARWANRAQKLIRDNDSLRSEERRVWNECISWFVV